MTQTQLAKAVGVGVSTVRRWECHGDLPQKKAARRLIRVLQIRDEAILRYLRTNDKDSDDVGAELIPIGGRTSGSNEIQSVTHLRSQAVEGMIAGLNNGFVTGELYMDLAERVARMTGLLWDKEAPE
jgi:transcriptional regulator with XRE-family HTH domain